MRYDSSIEIYNYETNAHFQEEINSSKVYAQSANYKIDLGMNLTKEVKGLFNENYC